MACCSLALGVWIALIARICPVAGRCPSSQEMLKNLTTDYDYLAHPGLITNEQVQVKVMLYITSIVRVDQKEQQLAVEGYYRTQWTDPRLALAKRFEGCESLTLQQPLPANHPVWVPDIYFDNSVSEWYGAGSLTIYPDGLIFTSQRFYHQFGCLMSFSRLPFDQQTCTIKMGSYSWDVSNINATVFDGGGVDLPEDYKGTTEFRLSGATSEVETLYFHATGVPVGYSYVLVHLALARLSDSHMTFVFVTCILFAFASFSGLFINRAVAPARVAIAVIPVLIMLNLENNVISNLPPLNYMTWLTSYLLYMKFFCLSAVFEYGLISYLLQVETAQERKFLAFKHLAATVRKKEQEKEAAAKASMMSEDIPQIVPFASPQIKPSRGGPTVTQVVDGLPPVEFDGVTVTKEDAGGAYDFLQKEFSQAYRVFDRNNNDQLCCREVQLGFRRLGQYWSKDQVQELFYALGISGRKMTSADFKRFMTDVDKYLPGKAMHVSFFEQPPSFQVDVAFRIFYITGVVAVTCGYLIAAAL